jgi:hypothetical protein
MLQALMRRLQRSAGQLALVFDPPPRTAEALLERFRALGMKRMTRVRLTRNRNVMVSFRDTELRVHRGFLDAPDDVLAAIVVFVEGRTRAERQRAKRRLLSHPIPVDDLAPRRSRERTHPDDEGLAARFTEAHARLNAGLFGGELRAIPVRISRRMRARLGHYTAATASGDAPEIAISRRHLRRHGWDEAVQTLLHEMVHQWQDERGLPIDHGRAFREKARALGIAPHARRIVAA